ncbi:MAG: 50S ribosomal protein L18 [Aquificaceae bacterium]|nr:50S ribosomal protein L18 [Aquificaceae bacterium]
MAKLSRHEKRERRHKRIRKKLQGTQERPRLCVYRSLKAFYAQIIEDRDGNSHTIVSASSIDPEFAQLTGKRSGKSVEDVQRVAEILVKKAMEKGIKKVVFDRGGFLYHGKIKAFADKCRELGLEF